MYTCLDILHDGFAPDSAQQKQQVHCNTWVDEDGHTHSESHERRLALADDQYIPSMEEHASGRYKKLPPGYILESSHDAPSLSEVKAAGSLAAAKEVKRLHKEALAGAEAAGLVPGIARVGVDEPPHKKQRNVVSPCDRSAGDNETARTTFA